MVAAGRRPVADAAHQQPSGLGNRRQRFCRGDGGAGGRGGGPGWHHARRDASLTDAGIGV
nr:hypothetical protein [Mycobacterium tuberculosis]